MTLSQVQCKILHGGKDMLYIIRHGKTDWNVRHKLQGRTDIPLNDEGRAMARKAHDECLDVHFMKGESQFFDVSVLSKESKNVVIDFYKVKHWIA